MIEHTYINTEEGLKSFASLHKYTKWLAFDTEFIGENKFKTLLCLIQIATEKGIFLLDSMNLHDISPFLEMVENPDIEKITHAGDNDFRILFQNYGTTPNNIFDTQLACGFLGYGYPISFSRSIALELDKRIGKGQSVTDWSKRPLSEAQLSYAISDVLDLKELRDKLYGKLEESGKLQWYRSEVGQWEAPDFFETNPVEDYLRTSGSGRFNLRQRIYLYRLLTWREKKARVEDKARTRILSKKVINLILKSSGKNLQSLQNNRIIKNSTTYRYIEEIESLLSKDFQPHEVSKVEFSNDLEITDPIEESNRAIVLHIAKRICLEKGIAPNLVLKKDFLQVLRENEPIEDWRTGLLGSDMCHWLQNGHSLNLDIHDKKITLTSQ